MVRKPHVFIRLGMNGHQLRVSIANDSLRRETRFVILLSMYWTGLHTKHRHMFHIFWISKYRKRILKDGLARRIRELLEKCAEVNKWEMHELNIQIDHVDILVQLRPSV